MADKLTAYRFWKHKEELALLTGNTEKARIYFKRSCFYAPLPRTRTRRRG